jgi:hypothetical protein
VLEKWHLFCLALSAKLLGGKLIKTSFLPMLVIATTLSTAAMAGAIDTFSGTLTFKDVSPPLNNAIGFSGGFADPSFNFTGGTGTTYTDKLSVSATDLNFADVTQSDQVAIAATFTTPGVLSENLGGTGSLTDTFYGILYTDSGTITWNAIAPVTFSDGSVLDLSMAPIKLSGIDGVIGGSGYLTVTIAQVPEPLTLSIFGAGLAGAMAMRRRRKAAKA